VLSDGLACFGGIAEAGFIHAVNVTGGGRPKGTEFEWVNTGLGNTKGAITGTCRSCDARHAPRYLASYEYRYNRRFDLPRMIERPRHGRDAHWPAAAPLHRRRQTEAGGDAGVIKTTDTDIRLRSASEPAN
jgi:ISXO2-like transposase domain